MQIQNVGSATIGHSLSRLNTYNQVNPSKAVTESKTAHKSEAMDAKQYNKELQISSAYKAIGKGNYVNFTA